MRSPENSESNANEFARLAQAAPGQPIPPEKEPEDPAPSEAPPGEDNSDTTAR